MAKKVFVLLPDGVGIRNFVHTGFPEIANAMDLQIRWWNMSGLPLDENYKDKEVQLEDVTPNKLTPIYTRARKRLELKLWEQTFKDPVYSTYTFPFRYINLNGITKSLFIKSLIFLNSSKEGLIKVRAKINELERNSKLYDRSLEQLKQHKPDIIFTTTQRATKSIAPILAAKDLGIPTVSFVYSWDNVPKAMMVVEADYYFVWSALMKEQMTKYYPDIAEDRIIITGTPQFEPHFDNDKLLNREDFFQQHGLDTNKRYLCFSGDDVTTSPLDQLYLRDLAKSVGILNEKGHNLGIIFRRAPVDISTRFDQVLEEYDHLIISINPLWKKYGEYWNLLLPEKEDFWLLSNICEHSEMVINICSSMVFDFAIHGKPCIYLNYEQAELKKGIRDIGQNYNYVHFRSMPSKEAVVWAESLTEITSGIEKLLKNPENTIKMAREWFKIIAGNKPEHASERIAKEIQTIIGNK